MLKERLKEANKKSDNPHVGELNEFLTRLNPIGGNLVFTLFEYEGDNGFTYAADTKKLVPVHESTPTMADFVLSFDGPRTYFHIGNHYHDGYGRYNQDNLKFCNAAMVDVDDFPLGGFKTPEEKYKAIEENYPFIKEIPPCYIVDTGKKGFQAYWIFGYNISGRQAFPAIKTALTMLFNGDKAANTKMQQARLPYTRRFDGRTPEIIYSNENNYDFFQFKAKLFSVMRGYCVDTDRRVRDKFDESLFEKDKDCLLIKYMQSLYPFFDNEFRKTCKEEKLFVNWKEQSEAVKKCEEERKKKKEKKAKREERKRRKYNKDLSYFGARKKDLFKLVRQTKGNLKGHRNNFLFAVAANERFMHKNPDDIDKAVYDANRLLAEPLDVSEVECILRSAKREKLYNFSGPELDKKVPMHLLKDPLLPYSFEEWKKWKEEKNNKAKYEARRMTLLKKRDFMLKFTDVATRHTSAREIAEIMGISVPTVYKYLKKWDEMITNKRQKVSLPVPKSHENVNMVMPEAAMEEPMARPPAA